MLYMFKSADEHIIGNLFYRDLTALYELLYVT
jgi:hypothetical protein